LACVTLAVQPRPIAAVSSGMVFSQLQIRRRDAAALILKYLEPDALSGRLLYPAVLR
jgi:hypothetical protein